MSICARDTQPACPPGQNYYICSTTSYTGCCSHDPCQSGMCDNNAASGTCVPVTLTVTETVFTGTASSTAGPSGLGANDAAGTGVVNPSIGSATLAAGTNINDSSSIALDTTVRVTATATNTLFTTNKVSSSSSASSARASNTKSTSLASHPSSSSSPFSSHPSNGVVAGSVIGALAGLALLGALLLCCCRHRKRLSLKFRLKRKGSDTSELEEKEKELKVREEALKEVEKRKSLAPQAIGIADGGFVIDRGLGSPTGSGESGGAGMRRRSQDAREQVGRWI